MSHVYQRNQGSDKKLIDENKLNKAQSKSCQKHYESTALSINNIINQ